MEIFLVPPLISQMPAAKVGTFDTELAKEFWLGFARSVDPIMPQEVTITRVAITTEADAEKKGTEMGRKYIVPYGLYRVEGYISANLARKTTGFSEDDLNLLWTCLLYTSPSPRDS